MRYESVTVVRNMRVSTAERADGGSELAAPRVEAECQRGGWILDKTVQDAGCSASHRVPQKRAR
jgi:hypothetical protein